MGPADDEQRQLGSVLRRWWYLQSGQWSERCLGWRTASRGGRGQRHVGGERRMRARLASHAGRRGVWAGEGHGLAGFVPLGAVGAPVVACCV